MGKKVWFGVGLIAIIILVIIIIYSNGPPRSSECESDFDCPPIAEKVCRNDSACLISTIFRCDNETSQLGECVVAGGGVGCVYCPNGCFNGTCIPPIEINETDLIIRNITWISNTSTPYQDTLFNVTVSVENIGTLMAGPSNTSVESESVTFGILETPLLFPGQFATLETIFVLVPRQSRISLTATADVFEVVPESNEDNNQRTVSIPF